MSGTSTSSRSATIRSTPRVTPGPGPIQPRRLLPDFGDLDGGNNKFSSHYNSMRVNLVKRFSKGLQLNANYTWGRAMTNSSSLAEATVQNPYDLQAGMGARQHRSAAHLPARLRV